MEQNNTNAGPFPSYNSIAKGLRLYSHNITVRNLAIKPNNFNKTTKNIERTIKQKIKYGSRKRYSKETLKD